MAYYSRYNLFDNFFRTDANALRTDIKEIDGMYELAVEVPGIKKEDISIALEDGTLKITAKRDSNTDVKYVRKERFSGETTRSFYIGENYRQEDIHARFDNGELYITLPTEAKKIEETRRIIQID